MGQTEEQLQVDPGTVALDERGVERHLLVEVIHVACPGPGLGMRCDRPIRDATLRGYHPGDAVP